MDVYEEALQDIEDHYAAKQEAVEDKYAARRINPDERAAKKRPWKWGAGASAAMGSAGGVGYGLLELGWAAEAANLLGPSGPAIVLGGGALVSGVVGGGAGYWITDKAAEGAMSAKNGAMTGAERVEKGYLGMRERAAKGKTKAADWAGIDQLLGGSTDKE